MIIRCIRPWIKCGTHSAINDSCAGRGPHALGRTVLQKTGVGTGISKISCKQTNTVKFEPTNLVLKSIDEDSKLHVHLQKYLLFAKTRKVELNTHFQVIWWGSNNSKYQRSDLVRLCHVRLLDVMSHNFWKATSKENTWLVSLSVVNECSELNLPDITTVLCIQFQPLELTKNHQTK